MHKFSVIKIRKIIFNFFRYNESFVCQILLKTMMVFPRNDYALAKYLIDGNRIESSDLRRVMDIGALLESCNFGLFWRLLHGEYRPSDSPDEKFKNPSDVKHIIGKIAGFEDAVRLCLLFFLFENKLTSEL